MVIEPRFETLPEKTFIKTLVAEIRPPHCFEAFNPVTGHDTWAAVEGDDVSDIADVLDVPGGLYAVFRYRGRVSCDPKTYDYIFGTWLPQSAFVVDHRPHFAVMGEKFHNDNPYSEEELWVPVKPKMG